MTYAIFLLVTAVCAFGLNYLTNKICPAMVVINKSGVSNVHALRCITSFLLLLGLSRWRAVWPANWVSTCMTAEAVVHVVG